ncbi:uncharacterized protein LOC110693534 [Chenopodium quinoa]|uniref:uncharacterized protein LOC110693534 n=1 Tax=Chenopodium quinoa TaxID=63459 RepID=UPI000B79269A|nr:uncharacterized protein LOC110693534 [Chenopodium quinoa]
MRAKLDAQFGKFLEVIKNLHVSVPFVDAMKQMSHYSKFLKDLLSGRRECEIVSLTANCSAILSNKLPTKLKDPGDFSIPCSINGIEFDKVLCDLGASVSLMPYSVYQKLSVGTFSPTNITLQLADRSIKIPTVKVEDIPLRVGKFIFPVDFYVLEMDEDERIPIILGRPFLATSRAIIDVKEGKISLKIDNDSIEFDLNSVMQQPSSSGECFRVDVLDTVLNEFSCSHLHATNDPLESVLLNESIGTQKEDIHFYEDFLEEIKRECKDASMEKETPYIHDLFQVEEREESPNGKGAPKVEFKPLLLGLRNTFLGSNESFPVIVNSNLTEQQTSLLINVLRKHNKLWVISLMISKE